MGRWVKKKKRKRKRRRRRRQLQKKNPHHPQRRKRKNHPKRSPPSAKANNHNKGLEYLPFSLKNKLPNLKRASTLSIMIKMVSSDLKISVVDLMSLVKLLVKMN